MSSFDFLVNGDIIGAFFETFAGGPLTPFAPFFYGMMMVMIMGAIYFKTENLTYMTGIGMLIMAAFVGGHVADVVPQEALMIGFMVMVVSVAVTLFKVFRS